jgi:hypothetical protein
LANTWLFLHILHISRFAAKRQRPAGLTDSTRQALLFSTDYVSLLGQASPGLLILSSEDFLAFILLYQVLWSKTTKIRHQ